MPTDKQLTFFQNYQRRAEIKEADKSLTLQASVGTGGGNTPIYCVSLPCGTPQIKENSCFTLLTKSTGRDATMLINDISIRRITPLEAERLQSFPDNWTKIPYKKKTIEECSDNLRFKALGNAITVKVGEYILKRLNHFYL